MPGLALPQVQGGGFWDRAQGHMGLATRQYTSQTPKEETVLEPPGKTAGGAVSAGAGGAMAGSALAGSSAGPWGAIGGAVVGLLAYYLS